MPDSLCFVSACGMLGYGYPPESLDRAMTRRPAMLGVDSGSTDSGPYYLGSGKSFVTPQQVIRDLEPALGAARLAGIPLVIGSAGGSGSRVHVAALTALLRQIAARRRLRLRLAVIHADVDRTVVLDAMRQGRVRPCGPVPPLDEPTVRASNRIVAQMGTGPIRRALREGADVVAAGRACDTAIFAALPIERGFDPGLALHAAKIAECGTLCATPGGANDALICTLAEEHFTVEPANPAKRCTPETVAAHSLYEQPDPNCFYEPEGKVDLSDCRFEQLDERTVKVSGSRLVPAAQATVKLEGTRLVGHRAIAVAGIRDPAAIAQLDELQQGVRRSVARSVEGTLREDEYRLRFLRYGLDGVLGRHETARDNRPHEVGLVIDAVAQTQELADYVLSLARSTALHQPFPGRKTTAGNLAFPFSPSDFQGGPLYEFAIYHLLELDDPDRLFPVTFEEVG